MRERIENKSLLDKTAGAEEAASLIKPGMTVAFSGYTGCGYPKAIGAEIAKKARAAGEGGGEFKINLVSGAQVGPEVFAELAEADALDRVFPLIESKALAARINSGQVHYVEQQMSKLPRLLRSGAASRMSGEKDAWAAMGEPALPGAGGSRNASHARRPPVDVAVIEALAVTAEGHIIPTNSVGMMPAYLEAAAEIIVEINLAQPYNLRGLHDIHVPAAPPHTLPIPLTRTAERIGTSAIKVDPAKIRYIVETNLVEETPGGSASGVEAITANLMNFLEWEAVRNWGGKLPPLQTGFGNLTNALLLALGESKFRDLEFFCGGVSEAHIRLLEQGKAAALSAGSLRLSPYVRERLERAPEIFAGRFVLRNTEICNSHETVARLGVTAVNTGIEVDIYGNVNSSHIAGSRVVNGLGGGANFAQASGLSIVVQPSITKNGDISAIVPMVSHTDIIEHDVDVLITENGVADLRGLDDLERARAIIDNCAHASWREALNAYLAKALQGGGHHPVSLPEALSWHQRLKETGSMRE